MMTPRERILAVYNGQTPDRVPYMLDLSHYYLHNTSCPGICATAIPSRIPALWTTPGKWAQLSTVLSRPIFGMWSMQMM